MGDRLLVSTRKGLFVFARSANGWHCDGPSFRGENVTLALATPSAWYATINHGHFGVKLRRSTDAGQTWADCGVPTYPDGETIATGDGKPPQPASLKLIWALEPGPTPTSLWAGTAPGGLFRSDDSGDTWHLMRGLWERPERSSWFGGGYDYPGIHSICIDPRDPNTLRLAISCDGVWVTHDAGTTWQLIGEGLVAEFMPPELRGKLDIQDVHRMVQCQGSPDALWIQHHNGIFRSTNGGLNWDNLTDVKPSVFGFAVAVHPQNSGTAWFVPAVKDEYRIPVDGRFVVTRTRDGGKSFETLTQGLPTVPAYDLVYRHGLDVDSTGNGLAIGSTTGSLWVSDNQGDNWQHLTAHLPPIHAVRWVA